MINLLKIEGFDWDIANQEKNWLKHEVTWEECEAVFTDENLKLLEDIFHSKTEDRFIIIGKTRKQRLLYIAFTIRNNKIRVISARDINKKEIKLYEKTT